jgi:ribonucleoside-diphosphate reductase alpha chain
MATSVLDYIFRELAISYIGRNDLAHVQPNDLHPDAMGGGVSEGEIEHTGEAEAAMDAVKRYASTGYVRNSLVVLHNHQGNGHAHGNGHDDARAGGDAGELGLAQKNLRAGEANGNGLAVAVAALGNSGSAVIVNGQLAAAIDSRLEKIREARLKGYEGDACGECGNFTLVRNGTCLKCTTCGSTSGCS